MHKNCTGLWGEDIELATQNFPWYCKSCTEGLFPFNHFDEEMDFLEAIDDMFYQDAVVKLALKQSFSIPSIWMRRKMRFVITKET